MTTESTLITIDDIMEHDPCDGYSRKRTERLIGDGKTPLEILDLGIPAVDRIWVLTREGLLDESTQRLFAASCDEVALLRERGAGREPAPALWGAASAAAWSAAWNAVWSAAWGAAGAAAWGAARNAARDAQIEILRGLLSV